jgi:2,4-dienoyl-CoA reductase-like NADH-dependent reductase (Old Yellow Enzyme family)
VRLFEPFDFGGKLTIDNHIMMPPIVTRLSTVEGEVTDELIDRYMGYARGGAGIIVMEAIAIEKQKSGQLLRLNDDSFVPGLTRLTTKVHAETGAKIAPQIIHFLKISRSGYRQKVEDLEPEYVRRIPVLFAEAAYRSREAGFDAVELHFAHAYTMASFLSRHNARRDEYGGSLKKRLRLAEEVVEAARRAVGDDFVLGARMNGDEFTLGGNTLVDARRIALRLAELGLDYLSVSAGGKFEDALVIEGEVLDPYTGYSGNRAMPPKWMPERVNMYLAADIKRTLVAGGHSTPVVGAGRVPTAKIAEDVLQAGEVDLIGIARPILCDPDWPRKFAEGRGDSVNKCTYCNHCREMEGAFEEVTCIQWKKKKVAVESLA